MYGNEGIQKAFQELQQRPPTNDEAWLKFFI
jgi:hypothetical protein